MFRSLRVPNYRLWFAGALVSNTGAWMQRTAQDWIVLTELTDHDAAAVGITMALQFGPLLLLMPLSGLMADRFDRKRLLAFTQAAQLVLALGLGILVVSGLAQLWHVYAFALLLGIVTAIDTPARQTFVSELVADRDIANAVALNATSFQTARLIGPAAAGVLIALIGTGPVFLINAVSYVGVLVSLGLIKRATLVPAPRLAKARGQFRGGLRYVRSRPDIIVVLVMVFLVGTFGFNFPVFISTMTTVEFGLGSAAFGLLSSCMAAGAVTGALLAARRERARFGVVVIAAGAFGVVGVLAAFAPSYLVFAIGLVAVGITSITMMNTANAYVQTTVDPAVRGRVMALYMAIFAGGTPIGAPLIGAVANVLGPRYALVLGTLSGLLAAVIALVWLVASRGMRVVRHPDSRFRLAIAFPPAEERELATQQIAVVESTGAPVELGLARDLHRHEQRRAERAGVHAAQRRHVVVVAAAAHQHMPVADVDAVGGVEAAPLVAAVPLHPGVRLARDRVADRRVRPRVQVARDVAGRDADAAQRTQREVRDVLAHALAVVPRLPCGGVHAGHALHVLDRGADRVADLEGGGAGILVPGGDLARDVDHLVWRVGAGRLLELLHGVGGALDRDGEVVPGDAVVAVRARAHLDERGGGEGELLVRGEDLER